MVETILKVVKYDYERFYQEYVNFIYYKCERLKDGAIFVIPLFETQCLVVFTKNYDLLKYEVLEMTESQAKEKLYNEAFAQLIAQ